MILHRHLSKAEGVLRRGGALQPPRRKLKPERPGPHPVNLESFRPRDSPGETWVSVSTGVTWGKVSPWIAGECAAISMWVPPKEP